VLALVAGAVKAQARPNAAAEASVTLGLATVRKPPPPVRSLGLVHARLHGDTVNVIAANLAGLVALDITGGFVGAEGARVIADELVTNKATLTELNISGNSIGCAGARLMAEMLVFNDTLTHLDLSSNDIGDEGARAIGRGLKANDILACICVGDNPVSEDGVRKLLKIARECEYERGASVTPSLPSSPFFCSRLGTCTR
jgi:hypothetical protein